MRLDPGGPGDPSGSGRPLVLRFHSQIPALLRLPREPVVCCLWLREHRGVGWAWTLCLCLDTALGALVVVAGHPLRPRPALTPGAQQLGGRGTRAGRRCDPSRASAPGSRATRHLPPRAPVAASSLCIPTLCPVQASQPSPAVLYPESSGLSLQQQLCWRMRGLTRLCAPTPWVPPSRPGVIQGLYSRQSPRQPQGTGWGQPCGARKGHRGPVVGTFSSRDVVLVSEPLSTRWVSLLICRQRSRPGRALSAVRQVPPRCSG